MNKLGRSLTTGVLLAGLFCAAPVWAAQKRADQPAAKKLVAPDSGEFFIISSVNLKQNEMVLKRPTEVTLLIRVNDKTVYQDEQGKPLRLTDMRAGDTVYVVLAQQGGSGEPVALRLRKGPMTVDELHRRYFSGQNSPQGSAE